MSVSAPDVTWLDDLEDELEFLEAEFFDMFGGITATGLYVTGTGLGGAGLARTLSRADLGVYGGMYFFLPGSSLGASVITSLGWLQVVSPVTKY